VKKWQVLALITELGFTVGFSILIGIGVGWWLDGKFGTRPIFTLIGLFLGLASAGYNLYKLASMVRK